MTENSNPEMVPTANANQKTSDVPSKRKGTRPRIVEMMVRLMGQIFLSNARTYALTLLRAPSRNQEDTR